MEVNEVRSDPFTLTWSICQGCPLSLMLYILVPERFLHKLRVNPVLSCFMFPGFTEVASYIAYANNVSVLLTSSSEVVEKSKEIGKYEVMTRAKINP